MGPAFAAIGAGNRARGEGAKIVVPEYPGRTFPATMESSAEAVDSSTGTTRMQLGSDNSKRGVEIRALRYGSVESCERCPAAVDSGGWWPDADLQQRHLLRRLLGVKRTRYAQCELFRVCP